jgi:hypothetical protein
MVLSLGFILAFIGAAVGLLIGILIFGEISDAIICPGDGSGDTVFFDTLSATSDGSYDLDGFNAAWAGQLIGTNGEQITSVTVNNIDNSNFLATLTSEIWTGATTDIDSSTLVATSDNQLTSTGLSNFTWTFTPPVTVDDPNTFIALHVENWDSSLTIPTSSSNIGPGVIWAHAPNITSGFFTPFGFADVLMKVEIVGDGNGGQGNAECEQAKDTAWTVIGILPVALFFALFAIFGNLGRQS